MSDAQQEIMLNLFLKHAATPASSVADAAGAQTDAEALYDAWQTTIAYMDEQKSAAGASERADAEKDAARYRYVRGLMAIPGKHDEYDAKVDAAILAANKEKQS